MAEASSPAPASSIPDQAETPKYDNFYTPHNEKFYKTFKYRKLDRESQEIRLIRLLPDTGDSQIKCQIVEKLALAEYHNHYIALSYCAGDPKKTEAIIIDNIHFNVFANLGHALREVRAYWSKTYPHHRPSTWRRLLQGRRGQIATIPCWDKELLLWVDQICIDQSEMLERSHQVGFMRDIYQHAQQVLVCLSTHDWTNHLPAHFLRDVGNAIPTDIEDNWKEKRAVAKKLGSLFKQTSPEKGQKLLEIFLSQWWKRAWVYQEFIVSSDAIFLCAGQAMHWESLRDMARLIDFALRQGFLPQVTEWCRGMESALLTANSLLDAKKSWTGQLDIKDLLAHARYMDSSDSRDKVYAFLGLAERNYSIIPDYSQTNTSADVCFQVTRNIITVENRIAILALVAVSPLPDLEGPSWVLNLKPPATSLMMMRDFSYRYTVMFMKSKNPNPLEAVASFVDSDEETGPRLVIRGTRLAKTVRLVQANGRVKGKPGSKCAVTPFGAFRAPLSDEDELWYLSGARPPFVLRPKGCHYILIGVVWDTYCCDQDALGAVRLPLPDVEKRVFDAVAEGLLEWTEVCLI